MRSPWPLALAVAAGLGGCASTAPHSMGAAAINSAVALGASAATRSAGGCWAVCTDGYVCNPASGWCEKPRAMLDPGCPPGAEAGDARCRVWPLPTVTGSSGAPGGAAAGGGLGLSPASGKAPPPPNESSPGGPPKP